MLKSELAFARISALSEIRMFGFQTFTVHLISFKERKMSEIQAKKVQITDITPNRLKSILHEQ